MERILQLKRQGEEVEGTKIKEKVTVACFESREKNAWPV